MAASWVVQGFDGIKSIFAVRLSTEISEGDVGQILQRLASQHLTSSEIVGASLHRSHRGYRPLLELRRENPLRTILSVGENPHYVASVHTDQEISEMDIEFSSL
jgi:hypothetical protein